MTSSKKASSSTSRLQPSASTLAGLLVGFLFLSHAENIVFPANSGVIDITKAPYYADNTGQADVSEILTRALDEQRATGTWLSKIVYLPNGTYLVRNTIRQKEPPYTVGPHLQGQSKAGTVIRLEDGTWPTIDGMRFVLSTGNGAAQCFNRGVRNLTVNTGSNNAGASGIWWYGNNAALLTDVDVISEDGQGVVGFDGGSGESGPSMARNLYVKGFRIGVQLAALNAMTFMNLTVEGQSLLGVSNQSHPAWFDHLTSINEVTAVRNARGAKMVVVGADLSGGNAGTHAISNEDGGRAFLRDIRASGYRGALACLSTNLPSGSIPTGMTIDEFSSHGVTSQFGTAERSLNLPRKVPPEPEWEQDMNKWAVVSEYQSGRSDAEALQAAIDDLSKTAVAVDRELDLNETVYVRNNIKFIVGTVGYLRGSALEIVDGDAAVVKIQNLGGSASIIQRSSRTAILESNLCAAIGDGSGDLFLTDHVAGMDIRNPQQNVWAWHFNSEGSGITISAGTIRCFGWKTEHDGTKVHATGGTLEMLGFYMYAPCGNKGTPLISLANTEFSMAMMSQFTFCDGALYEHLVEETQGGTTNDLYASDNPTGNDIPLYVSHNRVDARPRPVRRVPARHTVNRRIVVPGPGALGWRGSFSTSAVFDLKGNLVDTRGDRGCGPVRQATGVYILRDRTDGPVGSAPSRAK